jgi:hypothetical protein
MVASVPALTAPQTLTPAPSIESPPPAPPAASAGAEPARPEPRPEVPEAREQPAPELSVPDFGAPAPALPRAADPGETPPAARAAPVPEPAPPPAPRPGPRAVVSDSREAAAAVARAADKPTQAEGPGDAARRGTVSAPEPTGSSIGSAMAPSAGAPPGTLAGSLATPQPGSAEASAIGPSSALGPSSAPSPTSAPGLSRAAGTSSAPGASTTPGRPGTSGPFTTGGPATALDPAGTPGTSGTAGPTGAPGAAGTPGSGGTGAGSGPGTAARRLGLEFDGPRARVTHRQVETVTGRVLGGPADQLSLSVNEAPAEVVLGGDGTFGASVRLQPGLNRLHAVATGPGDARAEGSISIEYVPAAPGRIVFTSPADGFVLGPDAPPVIVVEGTVEDKTVTTLSLLANDRRIPVKVSEGRFRKVLPMFAPMLRLRAEVPRGDGPGSRSEAITVSAGGPRKPSGVFVMEWPEGLEGLEVEASAVVRFTPDRLDGPVQAVRLPGVLRATATAPFEVFWLRGAAPGAYTVRLRHRGAWPGGDLPATLYIPDKDGLATRPLPAVRLRPSGTTVLARFLLPYGVLWEQDDWFTGYSEGSDTVTKFRIPEGISWVERRADLP